MSIEHSPAREVRRKLRVSDAARFLGLSASTLNKLRVYGGGPAFAKLGRIVVYDMRDLDAWAAAHTHRCTSEYELHRSSNVGGGR